MRTDPGLRMRLDILQRDAEQKLLGPLRLHGWTARVEREVELGEYLVIAAVRGGTTRRLALVYSCATDNAVYKRAAVEVDHIFYNGEPYQEAAFAYGLDKPVGPVADFPRVLTKWNQDSGQGKFAPNTDQDLGIPKRRAMRILLSENPIDAVWLRIRQLQSVTLAEKVISERTAREGCALEASVRRAKAEGVSYALRNAADYFLTGEQQAIGQRVVNLYYGTLSFAFAEILASPLHADTLNTLENSTRQGHGLYTVDSDEAAQCQSASNRDPLSACKNDPLGGSPCGLTP